MRLYIASNLFAGDTFACTYHGRTIYEIEVFEFDTYSLFMNLRHAVYGLLEV